MVNERFMLLQSNIKPEEGKSDYSLQMKYLKSQEEAQMWKAK